MDAAQRQRDAEALVHVNYGQAYGKALEIQANSSAPQNRREAAAAMLAEGVATANRDTSAINMRDMNAGRAAMEQSYGAKAADVSAVLSGRVAGYDLPKGFNGTKDMSALVSKSQILVQQATTENYASRGLVTAVGTNGKFMEQVEGRAAATKEKLVTHMLHVKSAIESGVDRKEFDRSQGDMLYKNFQKAAFDNGEKKQSSADYAAFEKADTPRLRQEVMREVEARYEAQAKIIARAKEKELDPANVSRAEAFRSMQPADAIKKHPELAGAVAAMAAVEKQVEAHGLNPQQKAVVLTQAKQNMAASIEKGQIPEVKMREEKEVAKAVEKSAER